MSYTEVKKQISDAEAAIERAKAGYAPKNGDPRPGLAELKQRRKKLQAEIGRVLLLDHNDAARRDELKRELAEVDSEIAVINEEVESLQNLIATHKQYLSESAKLERKRAAIKAGERVAKRANDDVPKLADKLQCWLDEGTRLFAQLDEIASANSRDFYALANVALENEPDHIREQFVRMMEHPLELRFDGVLAAWAAQCSRFKRNNCIEIRSTMPDVSLYEVLERHADGLLQRVAELKTKIEQTQEEEVTCE